MLIIYELFERLIQLTTTLYDMIFYEINLPLPEAFGGPITISLWIVLTGSSVLVLFGAWLIKKLIPVA